MAILQLLLAIFSRTAARILNTAFAWATIALFGRVPSRQQLYLSVMAFGSMAWLISVIGIAFPSVATFLLAFVTVPSWIRPAWIRLVMALTVLVCPLVVGGMSLVALHGAERPRTAAGRLRVVIRGYLVTIGLSLTLALLLLFVPVLRAQSALRRWTTAHVPVLVKAEDYAEVLGDLERALAAEGWRTMRTPASWMLRLPMYVFGAVAGRAIPLVAERLTTLRALQLEVTLHPSDLVISGPAALVMKARARLAERLAFSRLYMTWTGEAQQLEDRLRTLWLGSRGRATSSPQALRTIERDLRVAALPFEEWEVLFREALLLERHLRERGGIASAKIPPRIA
jgi:hypothetical protein